MSKIGNPNASSCKSIHSCIQSIGLESRSVTEFHFQKSEQNLREPSLLGIDKIGASHVVSARSVSFFSTFFPIPDFYILVLSAFFGTGPK